MFKPPMTLIISEENAHPEGQAFVAGLIEDLTDGDRGHEMAERTERWQTALAELEQAGVTDADIAQFMAHRGNHLKDRLCQADACETASAADSVTQSLRPEADTRSARRRDTLRGKWANFVLALLVSARLTNQRLFPKEERTSKTKMTAEQETRGPEPDTLVRPKPASAQARASRPLTVGDWIERFDGLPWAPIGMALTGFASTLCLSSAVPTTWMKALVGSFVIASICAATVESKLFMKRRFVLARQLDRLRRLSLQGIKNQTEIRDPQKVGRVCRSSRVFWGDLIGGDYYAMNPLSYRNVRLSRERGELHYVIDTVGLEGVSDRLMDSRVEHIWLVFGLPPRAVRQFQQGLYESIRRSLVLYQAGAMVAEQRGYDNTIEKVRIVVDTSVDCTNDVFFIVNRVEHNETREELLSYYRTPEAHSLFRERNIEELPLMVVLEDKDIIKRRKASVLASIERGHKMTIDEADAWLCQGAPALSADDPASDEQFPDDYEIIPLVSDSVSTVQPVRERK